MKIGILTQPLTTNYGGILQNYALQQVLRKLGHEPYTIDYGKITWYGYFRNLLSYAWTNFVGIKPENPIDTKNRQKKFRSFIDANIACTKPQTWLIDWQAVNNEQFDALVVGSDQVWRPGYNNDIAGMFFKYCIMPNVKISYAASFGTDAWEYNEKQTEECRQLASRFAGISVREESGVALCKEHLKTDATCVLDPTLLLSKQDYCELISSIPEKKDFVFAYILDDSEDKKKEIQSFAQAKGLEVITKSAGPQLKYDDSIEMWISFFRDASYVVTDSFHGTAFSILFNKDFKTYYNKERGNSRLDSLLNLLGLANRLSKTISGDWNVIDWDDVNSILHTQSEKSIIWLTKQLEK